MRKNIYMNMKPNTNSILVLYFEKNNDKNQYLDNNIWSLTNFGFPCVPRVFVNNIINGISKSWSSSWTTFRKSSIFANSSDFDHRQTSQHVYCLISIATKSFFLFVFCGNVNLAHGDMSSFYWRFRLLLAQLFAFINFNCYQFLESVSHVCKCAIWIDILFTMFWILNGYRHSIPPLQHFLTLLRYPIPQITRNLKFFRFLGN